MEKESDGIEVQTATRAIENAVFKSLNLELWFDIPKESKNRDLGMPSEQSLPGADPLFCVRDA